jgi:tetraacyldisaccharide 4'-kinase
MKRPLSTEIWYAESGMARLGRALLTPLSWLYAGGWELYAALYGWGIKRAKRPHKPVVCIGNLVVGGSGKTPLTLHVADVLRSMGREVVIGCSGYGSPASSNAALAPSGELHASEWGDEPTMIRRLRPDIPLIVGRDRVKAAELCRKNRPNAVLVMDDGYQHLPVRKDFAIVVDVERSNRRCLPAGPYREPRRRLREADVVVPEEFEVKRRKLQFEDPDGKVVLVRNLAEEPVTLLCAIGDPERFRADAEEAGLRVAGLVALQDHDRLDAGNLLADLPADRPVVVTAKDWVKLRERPDADSRRFVVAVQDVELVPGDAFRARLSAKLNEVDSETN